MDAKIKKSLENSIGKFAEVQGLPGDEVIGQLETVFESGKTFIDKVEAMDEVFDGNLKFDELREIAFDLLLMNFFAVDVDKLEGDYLESEEWEDIEEQTLDRGTELLNLLLYLRECQDEKIEPQLEDYLKEFLLVDEDEFQDEHRIYEHVIANQALADSSYEEIAKVAGELPKSQELEELFYPMLSFFYEPNPSEGDLKAYEEASLHPAFDTAVYALVLAYSK